MTKLLALAAVLGLAAPALAADQPVAMSDAQLDQVAAGTGSLAPVTTTNLNINASPIIVTQTAVALNTQTQNASLASNGNGKCKGKGNAWGLAKQSQVGVAAASNTAKINYHVVQVNNSGG